MALGTSASRIARRDGAACAFARRRIVDGAASLQRAGAGVSALQRRLAGAHSLRWLIAATLTLTFAAACAGSDTQAPPDPSQERWQAVDSVLRSTIAAQGRTVDLTVTVYNSRDQRVFEKTYGTFDVNRRVAVASASKMIAALVLLDVVSRGELTFEHTTGSVLGWTGTPGTITLRHLLSFTSGMSNENSCTFNPFVSLAACVATIRDVPMVAAPGTRFDYGSTHLHVAARMAEVATGKSWQTLFRERLADPLGLPDGVRFFTLPNQALGESNPLVAGGLRTSAREYQRLLALAYHVGDFDGVRIATPSLIAAQAVAPYPTAVIGNSPYAALGASFRYGFGAWLECSTPGTGCPIISSAGLFGFTPWLDRDAGYYATIAMEESFTGASAYSVRLQQAVMPYVRAALASP